MRSCQFTSVLLRTSDRPGQGFCTGRTDRLHADRGDGPSVIPSEVVTDVIALAKKEPGKLTAGTTPPPTINYFAAELFKAMAGAEITIVSYKGTGPLTNDLVGGHVAVGFNTIPPAIGNIEARRLRAIAVAAPTRSAGDPTRR